MHRLYIDAAIKVTQPALIYYWNKYNILYKFLIYSGFNKYIGLIYYNT